MKVVLVRHGFSEGNLRNSYSGWTDVVLTQEGIDELIAHRDHYDYPKTDRYIASDLTRCLQTFEHLYQEETLYETSAMLREIYFGDYEDLPGDSMVPHYFDRFFYNERLANGEILSEFLFRIITKFQRILKSASDDGLESVTVVCHGGVIQAFTMFLQGLPFSQMRCIKTPNGLGYVYNLDWDENQALKLINYHAIEVKK